MTSERVTISLPTDLRRAAQAAAERTGVPFSTVVAGALAAWTRGQLVDAWLVEHQEANGAFTEAELQALARDAGVPYIAVNDARSAA